MYKNNNLSLKDQSFLIIFVIIKINIMKTYILTVVVVVVLCCVHGSGDGMSICGCWWWCVRL